MLRRRRIAKGDTPVAYLYEVELEDPLNRSRWPMPVPDRLSSSRPLGTALSAALVGRTVLSVFARDRAQTMSEGGGWAASSAGAQLDPNEPRSSLRLERASLQLASVSAPQTRPLRHAAVDSRFGGEERPRTSFLPYARHSQRTGRGTRDERTSRAAK